MDVPCDPGSLTRMFPFSFTCSWLVYLYVPGPVLHVLLLYHFGLSTHLCLPFCLTLYLLQLIGSSAESLSLDDYSTFSLWLYVLVFPSPIYI